MNQTATAEEFEQAARDRGLSIAQICREANVNQATFQRWKSGAKPLLSTYNSLVAAIDRLTPSDSEAAPE